MTLPKISLVMLSFNQGEFLEDAIKSVLEQDYPNLEYIIMDGGSTDNSVEIIEKYADKLSYWQSQPDGGQSAAINAGFTRAAGEIFCWLCSDDKFMPGTLNKVGEFFVTNPDCQWLVGATRVLQSGGEIICPAQCREPGSLGNFWHWGSCGNYLPQPSTFWTRGLWELAGGHVREDLPNSMDYELWLRFEDHARPHLIEDQLSGIVLHGDCKSVKNVQVQRIETISAARRCRRGLTRKFISAYESTYLKFIWNCIWRPAPFGFLLGCRRLFAPLFHLRSDAGQERLWQFFKAAEVFNAACSDKKVEVLNRTSRN